jgi:hypothetical protein
MSSRRSFSRRLLAACRRALLACVLATAAACGGGGGGDTPSGQLSATPIPVPGPTVAAPPTAATGAPQIDVPQTGSPGQADAPAAMQPPTAPEVTAAGIGGALSLTWTGAGAATSFVVQKTTDAGATWTDVGSPLSDGSRGTTLKLPVADWSRTDVRVRACNALGCTASAKVAAVQPMAASIRYLKASNTGTADFFGSAVALSSDGTTLAVGALREDSAGTGTTSTGADDAALESGAVYVFVRTAGSWSQQAYLKASNTGAGDAFGSSIALSADGNTLAVGAPSEDSAETGTAGIGSDDSASNSGAVYVFTRAAGAWSQQAYLKASNTGAVDGFGYSIALSANGSTLAVGAPGEDSAGTGTSANGADNSAAESGAVYVFVRNAGVWSQQAYLKASNTDADDRFGDAVAISGDGATLVIGAYSEDSAETGTTGTGANNSIPDSGAAYVFVRNAGSWSQQTYLKASNTGTNDWFGLAVAVSADGATVAVGAIGESSGETGTRGTGANDLETFSGAVYIFVRSAGVWSQQAYLKASNTGDGDSFGASIALSADGTTLVVGAYNEDGGETGVTGTGLNEWAPGAGSAYVFVRDGGAWTQRAYLKATNTGWADRFGATVAISADGSTVAIAAVQESSVERGTSGIGANDAAPGSGAVYVF